MTNYNLTVLRVLLHLGRVGKDSITISNIVNCVPKRNSAKLKEAIDELTHHGFIDRVSYDRISIKRERRDDVCRLVDPEPDQIIKNIKPIEETMSNEYEKKPFLITTGGHKVKGVINKYTFHKSKHNSNIVVYLVSNNQKKSTIQLGSICDRNSLYRKALIGIDSKFGNQSFTKAMMNQLGSSIVGNRQPTKALIDIMIYEGYLIQTDSKYFVRAPKLIPEANGLIIER